MNRHTKRISDLAQQIIDDNHIIIDSNTGFLYCYENGKYVVQTKASINQLIENHLKEPFSLKDQDRILYSIRSLAPIADVRALDNYEHLINFNNCILDLYTGKFLDHSPQYMMTVKLPCTYIATMGKDLHDVAPTFSKLIGTLCNDDRDTMNTLCQFIAIAVSNINGCHIQKALVLSGNSREKKILLDLIPYLVGEDNMVTSEISALKKDTDKLKLYQKRLCIGTDLSFLTNNTIGLFKSLIGGNMLVAKIKYANSFIFQYKGLFIFDCNSLPIMQHSAPYYRRFIVINCSNSISPKESDTAIIEKLKEEKDAIVSYLVSLLPSIIQQNYRLDIPSAYTTEGIDAVS